MAQFLKDFPGRNGLLDSPVSVENSGGNIIIVRPFDARNIKVALFDLDGTLSDERLGWPNVMMTSNIAFLIALSSPHLHHEIAEKMVIEDIEQTIGIPTYLQMKRLRTMIEANGYSGPQLDPMVFKNAYNAALVAMVTARRKGFSAKDLRITGARDLVRRLNSKLEKGVYLASGTDQEAVTESVEFLGFSSFFATDRIAGAGRLNPEEDAKEKVIANLLTEHALQGNELLTFGDGFPEILHTFHAGGVAVGIVSRDESYYEHLGHFTLAQKEKRLIAAGAHVIVRNPYHDVSLLLETIAAGY